MAVAKRKTKKAKSAMKKKKAPARRRARVDTITFRCRSGRCTVSHQEPHIGRKTQRVRLIAKNTSVKIVFADGSPFEETEFNLQEGDELNREIVNDPGEYEYDFWCGSCSRRLSGPPKMIVD